MREKPKSRELFEDDFASRPATASSEAGVAPGSTPALATSLAIATPEFVAALQRLAVHHGPLTLAEAAVYLHMSADTLRRVPTDQLPRFKAGKETLYYAADLDRFVRTHRLVRGSNDAALANSATLDLDAIADKARGRSRKRRTS
jgi:hypothetical protein